MRWALVPLLPLLVSGCGGSASDTAVPSADPMLQRAVHAGDLAFAMERNDEAAAQYRAALDRAEARDDAQAIGDAGYDLAVVDLHAGKPAAALAAARATRSGLARRGVSPFPALLLVEATALYRTGALADADREAQAVERSADRSAAARAAFLRGLIADRRGDLGELAAAAAALATATSPSFEADASELAARPALRQGDAPRARWEAARARTLRQTTFDHRGLARALALEGTAAERSGDTLAAAGFFLRAGRSAALQGNTTDGRAWLDRAVSLAPGRAAGRAATTFLHDMDRNSP